MADLKEQVFQSNTGSDKPSKKATSKDGNEPGSGIRHAKTTSLFRVVNFELYARPNALTMILGASLFLSAVGYITYMRYRDTKDNQKMYNAMDEEGHLVRRERTSKWD
ncbi:small integral membrane protein 8-like [Mizuhopecten yessoensis]|uniref:Small integral membrane protein 8 n=1 Tax=Mizuhopecten yessoensis TaxID=6573 RepID=A0A210PGS0_MIZYE|nr:small integral membrane protein 8-like [Mizuhopecten yessoensis]OWF35670.1 Small integral membrane protein 8 [Mizuhopecten yessoensis]